jgi:putative restriction endonuclease
MMPYRGWTRSSIAVHGFIATTDQQWFEFHLQHPELEEVNFWAPSGRASLASIPWGSPFLFKLKAPHHAIGGFGLLGPITSIPLSIAWETFREKNGASSIEEMRTQILRYRTRNATGPVDRRSLIDPIVGCRTILHPVFFPPPLWIPAPRDWAKNIVQGKTYDLESGEGRRLWTECIRNAALADEALRAAMEFPPDRPRWGAEQIVRPRLGQGSFRLAVTDAYGRACAVTDEHSLPVLDSAHIKPYAKGGAHDIRNGVLLRTDLHRLYDQGYVTVTPDYEFRVSDALRDEYANGRVYYALETVAGQRKRIRLPRDERAWPDREALEWHGKNLYRR